MYISFFSSSKALRKTVAYGSVQKVLQAISESSQANLILANRYFWTELNEIMSCTDHVTRMCGANTFIALVPEDSDIAQQDLGLYKHVLPSLPKLIEVLSKDEGPLKKRIRFAEQLLARCTNPTFARAYEPAFPTLINLFKRASLDKDRGVDDMFGVLVTFLNNLATCEDVTPTLRDLGVVDLAAPLLSNSISVLRVFGLYQFDTAVGILII